MLSLHIFQDIFHQFGIGNPCPDLRLIIPWVVVAPVIVHRIHYAFNGLVQLSLHCKMVILKTSTDYTPLFLQR